MNKTKLVPRCSFCYNKLQCQDEGSQMVFCPGCSKRRYCNVYCRESDWLTGQSHYQWCGQSGEQDFDWEINFINDTKEYGVIAKTEIPRGYKIMVERNFEDYDHEAFGELAPVAGTTSDKIQTNGLGTESGPFICLRISRINHSCTENAFHFRERDLKLVIASRDIQKGEEILMNYTLLSDPTSKIPLEQNRDILQQSWGIICSPDCRCYNSTFLTDMHLLRTIHQDIFQFLSNDQIAQALEQCRAAEQIIGRHGNDPKNLSRLYYYYFQALVSNHSSLEQAKVYATKKYSLALQMYGPNSHETLKIQRYSNHPEYHPRYASCDLETK